MLTVVIQVTLSVGGGLYLEYGTLFIKSSNLHQHLHFSDSSELLRIYP